MIYVVSDIHGYLSRFFDLLNQVNFDWEKDELYILGDMIDRGPESAEALFWSVEIASQFNNIYFLLGNHEDMAYSSLSKITDKGPIDNYIYDNPWSWNGGYWTLDNCREFWGSVWCHKAAVWIAGLPQYYVVNVNGMNILLVHAGIAEERRMSDDYVSNGRDEYINIPNIGKIWSQNLLWIRNRWLYNKKSYLYDYIIYGHTPTTYDDYSDLNMWGDDDPYIYVHGKAGDMIRLSGYGNGHMRYAIDTGRSRMGMLRLDDMQEFYSELEIEESYG